MATVSRKYDAVYRANAPDWPLDYVRALAHMESGQNPNNKTGNYWGLLQAGQVNLADYNKKHGTSYGMSDLLDPVVNVKVWAESMATVRRVYARFKGSQSLLPPMSPRRPDHSALITAGWNSGMGAVSVVSTWLVKQGIPVTHDNVFKYAVQAAVPSRKKRYAYLFSAKKRAWQRGVASLYTELAGAPGGESSPTGKPPGVPTSTPTRGGFGWMLLLLLLAQLDN